MYMHVQRLNCAQNLTKKIHVYSETRLFLVMKSYPYQRVIPISKGQYTLYVGMVPTLSLALSYIPFLTPSRLCRDVADMPIRPLQTKALETPKRCSSKPLLDTYPS